MKKILYAYAVALLAAVLCSCENPNFMLDDDEKTATSTSSKGKLVNVSLRSASNSPVEYPVHIYAFDETGICKSSAIITENTENSATLTLPKGTYRLTAVSIPETYQLSGGDISQSSLVNMPDKGYALSPFSTGNADILVTSSASQAVSIRMGYRQAAVNVRLLNTPSDVTGMNLSLSTPYSAMTLDGSYKEAKSVTIPSVKSGESWVTETFYILPTRPSQTILTMHLTFDSGATQSYSYTYNATLDAGVPYIFNGMYDSGVSDADITTTIQGGEWGQPVETNFDFGPGADDNSVTNGATWYVSAFPKAGDVIFGHVVVMANEASEGESEILLLSLDEWSNVYSALNEEKGTEYVALMNSYMEDGLGDWRLPTEAEAKELNNLYSADEALAILNATISDAGGVKLAKNKTTGGNVRYLCEDGKLTFSLLVNGKILDAGKTVAYNMRLVKSVTAKLR